MIIPAIVRLPATEDGTSAATGTEPVRRQSSPQPGLLKPAMDQPGYYLNWAAGSYRTGTRSGPCAAPPPDGGFTMNRWPVARSTSSRIIGSISLPKAAVPGRAAGRVG